MSDELNIAGMSLAPGVVETIVSIAANEIKGVASVGVRQSNGLRSLIPSKNSTAGIEVEKTEDGKLAVALHLEVDYGSVFPELAAEVRTAVADALRNQLGIEVSCVDIYIDAIHFD